MMTPEGVSGDLIRRAGPPDPATGRVHHISAKDAGWKYVGFDDYRLEAGSGLVRPADDHEVVLVVMEGSVTVRAGDQRYG